MILLLKQMWLIRLIRGSCEPSPWPKAHIDTSQFGQRTVPVHETRIRVGIGDAVGPLVGEVAEPLKKTTTFWETNKISTSETSTRKENLVTTQWFRSRDLQYFLMPSMPSTIPLSASGVGIRGAMHTSQWPALAPTMAPLPSWTWSAPAWTWQEGAIAYPPSCFSTMYRCMLCNVM